MFSKKIWIFILVLCVLIGGASFLTGHQIFHNMPIKKINVDEVVSDDDAKNISDKKTASVENEIVKVSTVQKITPSTKIVYQYYYPEDDVLEEQEDVPPYFLLDLTLEDMKNYYDNWQIISFSDKEVIMRKTVEGKSQQRYIVGQQDGCIAVFYEEEKDGVSLHELTNIQTSLLSHEEQVRLNDGIFIVGDEELARVLEDYGS